MVVVFIRLPPLPRPHGVPHTPLEPPRALALATQNCGARATVKSRAPRSSARRLIVARGTLADHGRSPKEQLFAAAPPSLVLGGRKKPGGTPRSGYGKPRLAGARSGRPCPQRPALRSLAPDIVPSLAIPPAPGGRRPISPQTAVAAPQATKRSRTVHDARLQFLFCHNLHGNDRPPRAFAPGGRNVSRHHTHSANDGSRLTRPTSTPLGFPVRH